MPYECICGKVFDYAEQRDAHFNNMECRASHQPVSPEPVGDFIQVVDDLQYALDNDCPGEDEVGIDHAQYEMAIRFLKLLSAHPEVTPEKLEHILKEYEADFEGVNNVQDLTG
jgi:hypothetical protein